MEKPNHRHPGCCACAASGQVAAPPISVMNSRRLMGGPSTEGLQDYHILMQNGCVLHHSKNWSSMSARGVRRGKAALSSGCKSHPATAPAGSNRSSHGGDEVAEASG